MAVRYGTFRTFIYVLWNKIVLYKRTVKLELKIRTLT